jgi:hypothetical protein
MPARATSQLSSTNRTVADEPEKPREGEVNWLSFVKGYLLSGVKWPFSKRGAGGSKSEALEARRRCKNSAQSLSEKITNR